MQAVAGLARSPVVQQAQAVRVAAVLAAVRLQAQQARRTRVAVAVVEMGNTAGGNGGSGYIVIVF